MEGRLTYCCTTLKDFLSKVAEHDIYYMLLEIKKESGQVFKIILEDLQESVHTSAKICIFIKILIII